MARYVDIFFKVSVPIKAYTKLATSGSMAHPVIPGSTRVSPDENFRAMIEHRFQGINKNITVTKDRPTQER